MDSTGQATDVAVFRVSLAGSLLFAIGGIAVGLIAGSQAVVIDGLYTAAGAPVALVSIAIVRLAARRPTEEFPLGFVQARPLLELGKSLVLTGVLIAGALEAVQITADGGRALPGIEALVYAGLSTIACFVISLWISAITGRSRSTLAALERKTWFKDGLSSAGIGVAFAAATVIDTPWMTRYAVYIDQVLVLMIAVAFLPGLIATIVRNTRELMLAAPDRPTRRRLRKMITARLKANSARLRSLTTVFLGGRLLVEIEVVLRRRDATLDDADRVRADLIDRIAQDFPGASCHVSFYKSPESN